MWRPDMNITLKGTQLVLTSKLRELVNRKLNDAMRAFGDMNLDAVQIAVELENTSHRYLKENDNEQPFRAEANVSVPGHTLRVEETASSIEQAIIKLKHTLTRDIRKWRERTIDNRRKGARQFKVENTTPKPTPDPERTESWVEEWLAEEKKMAEEAVMADDKKWEEWEEDGIDQRDFV